MVVDIIFQGSSKTPKMQGQGQTPKESLVSFLSACSLFLFLFFLTSYQSLRLLIDTHGDTSLSRVSLRFAEEPILLLFN
jgi:hypothetical protein